MQPGFQAAISQLCEEKGIDRETVLQTVEAALVTAYRKDFGNRNQRITVDLDDKTEMWTVYLEKEVAKKVGEEEQDESGKVTAGPDVQIELKEAQKIKPNIKVGDILRIDVTPVGFGRIAAQSAKQVIIQRIKEAENQVIYEYYKEREDEIIPAIVQRVEGERVLLEMEKTIGILEKDKQIPNEKYRNGQRLRVYIEKVEDSPKGPQIVISRTHSRFIRRLLELEVPEVYEGMVEIKSIAREPGVRTKIAVSSNDDNIDPVGSCVGQRGIRIQNIMNEIGGEYVDIIEWDQDTRKYITRALAPAKITKLVIDEVEKHAYVFVEEDERSLAIGKKGQNVRLASKLAGLEIDIISLSDLPQYEDKIKEIEESNRQLRTEASEIAEMAEEAEEAVPANEAIEVRPEEISESSLTKLDLPKTLIKKLEAADISFDKLKEMDQKAIEAVPGIGKKSAEKILAAIKG